MATIMEMPKLSDTMKEGVVARWLKKEGEKVTAGSPVIEIETDKATMEFESPASGSIIKILVGDGGTCELNAPIAVIGKEGENWEEALEKYTAKKQSKASPAKGKSAENATGVAGKPQTQTSPSTQTPQTAASTLAETHSRVKASPLAKKIAAEKGLSLQAIQGSGPNGRVIVRDLENAAINNSSTNFSATQLLASFPAEVTKVPLSNMRKTIARRLTESVLTNPHFYLTISINMGPILDWRKQAIAKLGETEKFSVNDLLVFLVSKALRKHPNINAAWQEDHIAQYGSVHMGVAVALPAGLVTPVVRHSDKLNILQIAQTTKELVKKARDGKLAPEEYQGGTFTISNLGMNGIEEFTAIINPPQAAILAVGATIPTPVVNVRGEIVVEQRMKVTLSCDHRVIDGAAGSEFLKTFKTFLEDPVSALFF